MRIKRFLIPLPVVLAAVSCTVTTNHLRTVNVRHIPAEFNRDYIYSLPMTSFRITVETEKKVTVAGPFSHYAGKYLSIENVPREDSEHWRISGVRIEPFLEPDPDHYYAVHVDEGKLPAQKLIALSREGLIFSGSPWSVMAASVEETDPYRNVPHFTDLSVKRNFGYNVDTLYKTILTDSSFIRVPVLRKQLDRKTLEEKAEEAANFLIKLRKRRFKLMSGQYEVYPEGEAMSLAVKELNKLEKEYLSLFAGKTYRQVTGHTFYVTPESGPGEQFMELFRFSPLKGLLTAGSSGEGQVIGLRIVPLNRTVNLELNLNLPAERMLDNKVVYRIPDMAELILSGEEKIFFRERYEVFQMGTIAGMRLD